MPATRDVDEIIGTPRGSERLLAHGADVGVTLERHRDPGSSI
jgi:hypothetical protein